MQVYGLIARSHFFEEGNAMGNKIVTEADRKFTPQPPLPNGVTLPTPGRGQRVSRARGAHTHTKKNPGKRHR
jgi:hypothetical protein